MNQEQINVTLFDEVMRLKDELKKANSEIERYEFALSKIMNTQCFMSNGKIQYTVAGQIAQKALEG